MLFVASQVAGSVLRLNTYLVRGALNPPPQRAHWGPRTPLWRRSSSCESLLWEAISHLQEPSTAHISLTSSAAWSAHKGAGRRRNADSTGGLRKARGKIRQNYTIMAQDIWVLFEKKLQEGEPDAVELPEVGKLRWRVQLLPCWQVPFIYGFIILCTLNEFELWT